MRSPKSVSVLFTLKNYYFYKFKDRFKEMKKIEYVAPELEVLNLKIESSILDVSYNSNPGMHNEEPDVDPGDIEP